MKILLIVFVLILPLPGETHGVTYEVFSIPLSEAAKLRRAKPGGTAMYWSVVSRLGEMAKQEVFLYLIGGAAPTARLLHVEEYIFPSEYEHPMSISCSHPGQGSRWEPPAIPLRQVPSAFDTKYLGDVLEVEVQKNKGKLKLHLQVYGTSLIGLDHYGDGVTKVAVPRFAVPSIKTSLIASVGRPFLVGSISPPLERQGDGEKRVWLAFVTVTKVEN